MAKDSTKQQEEDTILNKEDTTFPPAAQDEGLHHVNNPVLDLLKLVKNDLGPAAGKHQKSNNCYFTDGSACVEVKVVSDEIIRVRLAPKGTFLEDSSYAVPQADKHVA